MSEHELERVAAVLHERAVKLAQRTHETERTDKTSSIMVTASGDEQFGIPLESLSSVVHIPPIAVLPESADWLTGLVQIRGELISVIDLAKWFGLATRRPGAFLAVLEGKPGRLGLLVERVVGFREITTAEIAESFGDEATTEHPVRATTRDLITILDIDRLFSSRDIRFHAPSNNLNRSGQSSGADRRTP